MTLEDLLREAAAKGLTHLTLYPTPSEDGKKTYWLARATPSTMHSYVQTNSLDPVEAMSEVLKALPKAKRRVTATVKDETPPGYGETEGSPRPEPEESEMDKWLPKT